VTTLLKRLFTGLAAVSVILLALTKIGVTPIAPGLDTGFQQSSPCVRTTLCLETDGGDLKALVTLWVRRSGVYPAAWHAELSDGTRLAVRAEPVARQEWRLSIARPDTTSQLAKFSWPSGLTLKVWNDEMRALHLSDWRVDVPDREGYDSYERARWRKVWFVISLLLLIVGAIAAVSDRLSAKPVEPGELDVGALRVKLVRATIAGVEGDSDAETVVFRSLLDDVLLGTLTVNQAILRVAPDRSMARRQQLWFTAQSRFLEQWDKLLVSLQGYRTLLQ
jgi:hypothetical protein